MEVRKKALYIILLASEFLVGFNILAMSTSLLGWVSFLAVTAVWGALMAWQIVALKKATEIKAKRKAKILIAPIKLIPIADLVGICAIAFMDF